jgi:DNA-binding transcriptional MerR regulator
MSPKLYNAAEVCEMTRLQPYVLRSWEKEFPGIGVQKSPDSPRLYRQSDVDQVQRIKHLVFVEGLTLAGARRRLEEAADTTDVSDDEVAEVIEALGADARMRLVNVRDGLRSILELLSSDPGYGDGAERSLLITDVEVPPRPAKTTPAKVQSIAARSKARSKSSVRAKSAARPKAAARRKRAHA